MLHNITAKPLQCYAYRPIGLKVGLRNNIKFLIRLLGDMCKCYVIITNVINQEFQKIALVSYNTKYKITNSFPEILKFLPREEFLHG